MFECLAAYAKDDVIVRQIGATDEIVNMLDSFVCFIKDYFFSDSQGYPPTEGSNRNGIAHGTYTDAEYDRPICFYKTIAAVDFLTFVSSLSTTKMLGFVPARTPQSTALAERYVAAASQALPVASGLKRPWMIFANRSPCSNRQPDPHLHWSDYGGMPRANGRGRTNPPQRDDGHDGSWVHAYLHCKEGDRGNAACWYGRAEETCVPGAVRCYNRHALRREWQPSEHASKGDTI